MALIQWQQDPNNRLIISLKKAGGIREFYLADAVIGYLAVNKLVHLHVVIEGVAEVVELVNFQGIKPISSEIKALGTKKISKEQQKEVLNDKCAIARGETFSSKWLSPRGWSSEKHFFALEPLPAKEAEKRDCPFCGKQIPATSKFCGFCGKHLIPDGEKTCVNEKCGRNIKVQAHFCPYCGIKQQ